MNKPRITFGGALVAATSGVAWKFVAGTSPYQTVLDFAEDTFSKVRFGTPQTLRIGNEEVSGVYALHEVGSRSPNVRSVLISDVRWKWSHTLVLRKYNVPRRTGNRTILSDVPVDGGVTVDRYTYRYSSLNVGEVWTAEQVLKDVVGEALNGGDFQVDSFPVDKDGKPNELTIQNVIINDPGDQAIGRALGYIPGAGIYVDQEGTPRIFDMTDIQSAEEALNDLGPTTWDGDYPRKIDRSAMRPGKVIVHFEREVEALFSYSDNYASGSDTATRTETEPWVENVIPTVDPRTTVSLFNHATGQYVDQEVPAGTWVNASKWLEAMDEDKPEGSPPWDFKTLQALWVAGDMEGVMGAKGKDNDTEGNVAARVAALRTHFRQTFRVNPAYMESIASLKDAGGALLDPVSGSRGVARVWGRYCVVPSDKGGRVYSRSVLDDAANVVYRNVDVLAAPLSFNPTTTAVSPASIDIIDEDQGVFRVSYIASPYGLDKAFFPCNLAHSNNTDDPAVATANFGRQDQIPMIVGGMGQGEDNGIFLRDSHEMKFALMATFDGPNDKRRCWKEEVTPGDLEATYGDKFQIRGGKGPDLEIYVTPGENTARFALGSDSAAATNTMRRLAGPGQIEIDENEMDGYQVTNDQNELRAHARAVAAEMWFGFSDTIQGNVVTKTPGRYRLTGNLGAQTITVGANPSATILASSEFQPMARGMNRLALMPDSVRRVVLGVIRFS